MKLRLSGIVEDSIVDGPGLRLTVFTQGCPHRCPGCHNPQTHPFEGGTEHDTDEILLKLKKNPLCAGITLSGGEPFAQAEALSELAAGVRALKKNVWTYTGYTYEQLLLGTAETPAWGALLRETDVLVDGPFLVEERTLDLPFRGSRNQRILYRQENDEGPPAGRFLERKLRKEL